jgi:hypothetical protein
VPVSKVSGKVTLIKASIIRKFIDVQKAHMSLNSTQESVNTYKLLLKKTEIASVCIKMKNPGFVGKN